MQNRTTTLAFSVNQTNYPQAQPLTTGYDVFVPFQVAYTDAISGQPIAGASCNVTNNVTSDIISLSYNSSTGNYTGSMDTADLYSQVIFNATCFRSNYSYASNSTDSSVTLYDYLWSWENLSYGGNNSYDIYWLRKTPPSGPIVNLTENLTVSAGANLVREFYLYNVGVNGSFFRDLTFQGNHTLRLNVSINDTVCQPYLIDTIQDFNLNVIYPGDAADASPQSIAANTPTLLVFDDNNTVTANQGDYLTLRYYLNCSAPASISTSMFFNNSILQPNFESPDAEPTVVSTTLISYNYPANYLIGPQQMLNVTRNWSFAFNNTGSSPQYYTFQFISQILGQYPDSNMNGSIYVYNSTGDLWASDNVSAGAPNVATSMSDNSIIWSTEELAPQVKVVENLTRGVLNAIRDNETLLSTDAYQTVWNISLYDVFIPQLTIFNVTAFTNYSTYNVSDSYNFAINMTNASGTFDVTNQTIINISAKTLTFPAESLGPVSFTVAATTNSSPIITFVPPTPDNGSSVASTWAYINFTSDRNLSSAVLDWNGTNVTMNGSGTNWFYNETGLVNGTYAYDVFGNDTFGNIGVNTGTVTIDLVPPQITFVSPTPANGTVLPNPWAYINITSDKNLSSAVLDWNGTNVTMSGSGTNWFYNETGLGPGNYPFKIYGNDTLGNLNVSETRTVHYETPPFVVILSPLGESHYQSAQVSLSVNATNLFGIDTSIAQVTYPNGSMANFTLHPAQQSDSFGIDDLGTSWFKENLSIGPSQTCIADINATYPGKAFTSISGNGAPETDTTCSLIAARTMDGDFDINVSFNITGESGADNALNFVASERNSSVTNELVFISLSNWTGLGKAYEVYMAGENFSGYIYNQSTNDTYGKLRIVRAGDLFSFYIWNNTNDSWYLANSTPMVIDRPLYPAFTSESALPSFGAMNVTWDDFGASGDNATFTDFGDTLQLGLYNVTFFVNDTVGAINNSEKTNFTVVFEDQPPSKPFILSPSVGSVLSGMQTIAWSNVLDYENDSMNFNITLLNPDGSDNATIVSDYGDINSTSFLWNTSLFPDGQYSIRVTVFENETPEHLANTFTLAGTFYIDNQPPSVVIIAPLGENYAQRSFVSISTNITDLFGISSAIAQVTEPNGSAVNVTLGKGQQSDDFAVDDVGTNWTKYDLLLGPSQTCIADIDTSVAGAAYTSLSGDGTPESDTHCLLGSNSAIDGDFDIQVSFDTGTMEGTDHAANLVLTEAPPSTVPAEVIYIARSDWTGLGSNYEIFASDGNFSGYIEHRPTTDTSGKMRIKRVGDNFTFFIWNDSASDWTQENVSQSVFNFSRAVYVSFESESALPGWGTMNVTWTNFTVDGSNNTFGMFNETSLLGLYNVSLFVNDTFGNSNNTEKTNFTVVHQDSPPSTPYILTPYPGAIVSGTYNITWSTVTDLDNDSVLFNITLLNPDMTFNRTIVSDYGNITSNDYVWNTSSYLNGLYSIEVTVFENATPEQLSTSYIQFGNFTIDNGVPTVAFVAPTDTSGSIVYRQNVLVNVTASDPHLSLITVQLFNASMDMVNESFFASSPAFINFTGLDDGIYYFNATATNFIGNQNQTETRNVTVNATVCLGADEAFQCGDTVNESCVFVKDLPSNGTCFQVSTDNVAIDCSGHSLVGDGSGYGVASYDSTNVSVENCNISSFSDAVLLNNTNDSLILNDTLSSSLNGILLYGSSGDNLSNNNASGNSQGGFNISYSDNNWLFNDSANGNSYGLAIFASNAVNATKVHLYNDSSGEFYISTDATPRVVYLNNITIDNPAGNHVNETRLKITDIVEPGAAYSISWTPSPATPPNDFLSFGQRYVNISLLSGSESVDSIVWIYHDSELLGYNASDLGLWQYNSSGWTELNATPDAHSLSVFNLNMSGIYGILEDNQNASFSFIKFDQTALQPSPGGIVQFNMTITNTGNVTLNPVKIIDGLPAGLTFQTAYPAPDSVVGQTATWGNLSSLDPGATAVIYLNATVDPGVVDATNTFATLTNDANATGVPPYSDNVTAESTANVTVYYANVSVIKLDQTALQSSPGGLVQFSMTVTNTGNVTLDILSKSWMLFRPGSPTRMLLRFQMIRVRPRPGIISVL